MARADNRYSRFVRRAKVILPLAALALLSSLFLLARGPGEAYIPFSQRALQEIVRDGRILAPTYTGKTADGGNLIVAAETAQPRATNNDRIDVTHLSAELRAADGGRMVLSSVQGMIDTEAQSADLDGAVQIDTSDGYRLTTDVLNAALDGTRAIAPGPVKITGPGLP